MIDFSVMYMNEIWILPHTVKKKKKAGDIRSKIFWVPETQLQNSKVALYRLDFLLPDEGKMYYLRLNYIWIDAVTIDGWIDIIYIPILIFWGKMVCYARKTITSHGKGKKKDLQWKYKEYKTGRCW